MGEVIEGHPLQEEDMDTINLIPLGGARGDGSLHPGSQLAGAAQPGRRRHRRPPSSFRTRFDAWKRAAGRKEMLVFWTLGGVALGLLLGASLYSLHLSPEAITLIAYPGELLMRALQELVLPLITLALVTGVLSLRHTAAGSSRVVRWALSYYLLSMSLAVALGVALILLIRPGQGSPLQRPPGPDACAAAPPAAVQVAAQDAAETGGGGGGGALEPLLLIGRQLVPTNIVMAAAQAQYLGVIAFAVFFGATLASLGERGEPLIRLIELTNETVMKMISRVIWFTPIGVGSLVAGTLLRACHVGQLASSLALYVGTILLGFAIHGFLVLPLLLLFLARRNPFRVQRKFAAAFAMGFGTASSAATMPMTMECAVAAGCDEALVSFMVPLGTNLNRDGAALYEAATCLFIAQAHAVPLSPGTLVIAAVTATLAAIGGASIPMGAIVSMVTVLQAVGLEQYASDISVVVAVDWAIGMFRTVLNIWGDSCAVLCVDAWVKASAAAAAAAQGNESEDDIELCRQSSNGGLS